MQLLHPISVEMPWMDFHEVFCTMQAMQAMAKSEAWALGLLVILFKIEVCLNCCKLDIYVSV